VSARRSGTDETPLRGNGNARGGDAVVARLRGRWLAAGRSRLVLLCLTAAALLLPAAASSGVAARPAAAMPAEKAATPAYLPPEPGDHSKLSWVRAFDALHEQFSREYAFTEWKGIDWEALYAKYLPRIVTAEWAGDLGAYYVALKQYALETRDGHVGPSAATEDAGRVVTAAMDRLVGGGYGLIATRLDDGRLVASWVKSGGPAAAAGIRLGAELVRWDGEPVALALSHVSTVPMPATPTAWRLRYEQARYLVRDPVGLLTRVTFRNPGSAQLHTVRLRAMDDGRETLLMTDARSILNIGPFPERTVEHRILPGNVGYLRLYFELDLPEEWPGDHTPTLQLFRAAIADFVAAEVRGVVVDVRRNSGGSDQMVADFLASFFGKRSFYEYQDFYDALTGTFQIWLTDDETGEYLRPDQGVWIEPGERRYQGPIVCLVDNGCISSGEGIAMGLKRLPNARVVGFSGTNGSFGMAGDGCLMPGGFVVKWPYGRSLNEHRIVQVDARHGKGGVTPDVHVPMTLRNAVRVYKGDDVVLEYGLKTLRGMMK
jgi:carboxyl-terminal processing protease